MKGIAMRCAAAVMLTASLLATQSWAQEKDKLAMPGMQMPSPTPSPMPMPSPKATPSRMSEMEGMETQETKPKPSMGEAANPPAAPQTESPSASRSTKTLPNLSKKSKWPSPTADNATYSYGLFDLLEYQRVGSVNALRWDFLGWRGGDKHRLWFKSEGTLYPSSRSGGEADFQLLYGKLISPFFDLQVGGRVEQHYERGSKPTRVFAVVALQGLAPGRFDIEPTFFLSNKGKVSGRFTASVDLYQAQRLVFQPRFETEIAAQRDQQFGVEPGISDAEVGLRLRYEIRREFAPYFGISYRRSFGATRSRVLREGGNPNQFQFVIGVRTWF